MYSETMQQLLQLLPRAAGVWIRWVFCIDNQPIAVL
jgi:hypothetical protein